MSYTYPSPPVTVNPDATAYEVHQFLKSPTLLQRRLRDILAQKFIADYLLAGRFQAVGGAILYETGEEIYPADSPEAVTPLGEYPLTVMTSGELAAAYVNKWGQDSKVSDEAIDRFRANPAERALVKLGNGVIRHVDSVALGVIGSKVTRTFTGGAWTTGEQIITDVLGAVAAHGEATVGEGFDLSTVVLRPTQYAKVTAALINGNLLPREAGNPVTTTGAFDYLGLTWVTSTFVPFTDPFVVDRDQLGGMADEPSAAPGYTTSLGGVQVKSIRDEEHDGYRLRARRKTVPVVLEPDAGIRITGTGV